MVNVMVNDAPALDRSFAALAHPLRRAIVERLATGPASVGEAARGFAVSKPAISRHLRVLEEAGVVSRSVDGRRHVLRLERHPLAGASEWIDRQRALWERKFDVIEEFLGEQSSDQEVEQ